MRNKKERAFALMAGNGYVASQTLPSLIEVFVSSQYYELDSGYAAAGVLAAIGLFASYMALARMEDDDEPSTPFLLWQITAALPIATLLGALILQPTVAMFTEILNS